MAVKKKLIVMGAASGEQMLFNPKNVNLNGSSMVTAPREITFRVYKDEDGMLCASSLDGEVYTFGKTMSALWKNIKDVVECYYEVPSSTVTINLRIEADSKGSGNVETASGQPA